MSRKSRKAGHIRFYRVAIGIEFADVYEGMSDKGLDRWRKRILRNVELSWEKPRLPKYWRKQGGIATRVALVPRKYSYTLRLGGK